MGCHVRGFDIVPEHIDALKARAKDLGIENIVASVDDAYTYQDGSKYDIIIASEVFEHLLEPSRVAINIKEHMNVGSWLIVTTPNGYGPWELKNKLDIRKRLTRCNLLRRMMGKKPYVWGNGSDHCQFYTMGRLLRMFSQHSFRAMDSGKSDSLLAIFGPLRRSRFIGQN